MTDTTSPSWRILLGALLALGMVAATQTPIGLGILASFVRSDLGLTRTEIGSLITATIVVGAVLSPGAGWAVDRLGGRRSLGVLFGSAAIAYLGLAVADGFVLMFIPMLIAGVAQAGGNPVTNKLIARHVPAGHRGVLTGVKQSGVQAGVFVSGLLLPAVATAWGWRWAFGILVVIPAIGLAGVVALLPADRRVFAAAASDTVRRPLPGAIWFLTAFGALMGFGAAYTFLVPLFAEEALGMSRQAGGLVAGLVGLTSLFSRIWWARLADRTGRHATLLVVLAIGSVVAALVFLASEAGPAWLVWAAAVITGLTSSSWNSVGMLAVIGHAGHDRSGHASGVVMFGFLGGLAIGPTVFGVIVDATGGYVAMWLASIGALALAAGLAVWWVRSPLRPKFESTGAARRLR